MKSDGDYKVDWGEIKVSKSKFAKGETVEFTFENKHNFDDYFLRQDGFFLFSVLKKQDGEFEKVLLLDPKTPATPLNPMLKEVLVRVGEKKSFSWAPLIYDSSGKKLETKGTYKIQIEWGFTFNPEQPQPNEYYRELKNKSDFELRIVPIGPFDSAESEEFELG